MVLMGMLVVLAVAVALGTPLAGADAAGTPDSAAAFRSSTPSFGHLGTVVDSRTETNLLTGEVSTRTRTEEYDKRGRLVHVLELETHDDVVLYRLEGTNQYLRDGTQRMVTVLDGDGDGPEPAETIVSELVLNRRGVLVAVDTTYDYESDGVVDARDREAFTSDHRGRTLTVHLELEGGPGIGDDVVIDTTYAYDRHGNVTSVTDDRDFPATSQSPDERDLSTSTYDRRGRFTSGVDEYYTFDGQGDASLSARFTFTTVRNRTGTVVTDHATADFDGDGVVDGVQDSVAVYEGRRPTSQVTTTVENGVTTVDSLTWTYDHWGNLVGFVGETVTDGVLQTRETETDTYDTRGRIRGWVISDDHDGDGVVDEVVRRVYTSWDGRGRFTGYVTTFEDGEGNLSERDESSIVWTKDYETRTTLVDDPYDGTWDLKVVTVIPLVFG